MRRQQRFLVAMRDRALKLNVLPKLPSLIGLVQQTVATDVGATQMLALARLGSEIDRERISSLVLDTRFADPYRSPEGADLLLPRYGVIRNAVRELLTESESAEVAQATLEVLNGTDRAGVAQAAADFLSSRGYQVASVGNADRRDYRDTAVLVLKGNLKAGQAVASALSLPASAVREAKEESAADIRVIIGGAFSPPR
jgi:hypothetical protein